MNHDAMNEDARPDPTATPPSPPTCATAVRVRYAECDPMGVAHHTVYPVWFEIGRTDLCRAAGISYRDLETAGVFLAVVDLRVRYHAPARYDDALVLETTQTNTSRVKIEHTYRLVRDGLLLATGATTLACIGPDGRARPLPEDLQ